MADTDDARIVAGKAMSEEDLEEAVRDICRVLGVIRVHHRDSRGTTSGWPDDVLLGPHDALFREMKTQLGDVRPAQVTMLAAMRQAGLDADVWRPADLRSGRILNEIRAISRLANPKKKGSRS